MVVAGPRGLRCDQKQTLMADVPRPHVTAVPLRVNQQVCRAIDQLAAARLAAHRLRQHTLNDATLAMDFFILDHALAEIGHHLSAMQETWPQSPLASRPLPDQ